MEESERCGHADAKAMQKKVRVVLQRECRPCTLTVATCNQSTKQLTPPPADTRPPIITAAIGFRRHWLPMEHVAGVGSAKERATRVHAGDEKARVPAVNEMARDGKRKEARGSGTASIWRAAATRAQGRSPALVECTRAREHSTSRVAARRRQASPYRIEIKFSTAVSESRNGGRLLDESLSVRLYHICCRTDPVHDHGPTKK